jgi:hypothetical protein
MKSDCAPGMTRNRYPHEFSGGQRQRIGIARALAARTVIHRVRRARVGARCQSVQAQVVNLLMRSAARTLSLTYLFIAARPRGRGASCLPARRGDVSRPHRRDWTRRASGLRHTAACRTQRRCCPLFPCRIPPCDANAFCCLANPPSPANPPSGCVFHPRCPHPQKDAACTQLVPPLEEKAPGHFVACLKEPTSHLSHPTP